jgi:hypothetical protein
MLRAPEFGSWKHGRRVKREASGGRARRFRGKAGATSHLGHPGHVHALAQSRSRSRGSRLVARKVIAVSGGREPG